MGKNTFAPESVMKAGHPGDIRMRRAVCDTFDPGSLVTNWGFVIEDTAGDTTYTFAFFSPDGQLMAKGEVIPSGAGFQTIPEFFNATDAVLLVGELEAFIATYKGFDNLTEGDPFNCVGWIECVAIASDPTLTIPKHVWVVPIGGTGIIGDFNTQSVVRYPDVESGEFHGYVLSVGTKIGGENVQFNKQSVEIGFGSVTAGSSKFIFLPVAKKCLVGIGATASSASSGSLAVNLYPASYGILWDSTAYDSLTVSTATTTRQNTWLELPKGNWAIKLSATTVNYDVSYVVMDAE